MSTRELTKIKLIIEVTHIKDEQWVFGGHDLGRAVARYLRDLVVPPQVPSCSQGNFIASPLENKHMLDERAFLQGSIDDPLGGNRLTSPLTLIASNHNTRFTILDTVAKRLRREAGENHGVDCADSSASKESCDGMPSHGKIDGDSVALFDAERLQDIGD